jgi:16S rRNA (guanine1516-N2)-methyltransferase
MKDLKELYLSPSFLARLKQRPSSKDLFRKALGSWPPGTKLLDACGGFGRDALCFASWGFEVISLERHPEVFSMVAECFSELRKENAIYEELLARLSYRHADARDFFQSQSEGWPLIYLDPIYPERKKSALGKGELRWLKEKVGEDPDRGETLRAAWQACERRLVVKRPRLLREAGLAIRPTHIFEGSSTAYDVFVKAST